LINTENISQTLKIAVFPLNWPLTFRQKRHKIAGRLTARSKSARGIVVAGYLKIYLGIFGIVLKSGNVAENTLAELVATSSVGARAGGPHTSRE
jgi:hypothetical protein